MNRNVIDIKKITPKEINKEVNKVAISSLPTLISFFGGITSMSAWLILDYSIVTLIVGSLSSFLLSPAFFLYIKHIKGHVIKNEYVKELKKEANDEYEKNLKNIENFFEEYKFEKAKDQMNLIKNKYKTFEDILKTKFDITELAYDKYHTVADEVAFSVIYNLNELVMNIKANNSINKKELEEKIKKAINEEEKEILNDRLSIYENRLIKMQKILINNEKAITELDKFTEKMISINTDNYNAENELFEALNNLSKLSEQAEKIFK